MKYRDSGMPDENMWSTFFHPEKILKLMQINNKIKTFLDIGCGYGTFLLPASQKCKKVVGIDIDPDMIKHSRNKAEEKGYRNIDFITGDISTPHIFNQLKNYPDKFDYISLFNILHCENPVDLLKNVFALLKENGKVGVIHWKYEETPRGPAMEIRPKPQNITQWAEETGLTLFKKIDLPPYHYGLIFTKKTGDS
ncbi:MAG TPA: class I SAM-dependent methyltransferase [Spirochaetia bacterium]|nr:class I SAM-dependent methyltransferase [Spirochaetia bacterium]